MVAVPTEHRNADNIESIYSFPPNINLRPDIDHCILDTVFGYQRNHKGLVHAKER